MVKECELLHRAIVNKPEYWNSKTKRPTSVAFRDPNGVSLERNKGRCFELVKETLIKKITKELVGEARFLANVCTDVGCMVEPYPKNSEFHAHLWGDSSRALVTKDQAHAIIEDSEIIEH